MKKSLQWQALEYPLKVRTSDWYIATAIIVISIVVSAVIFNNTLFAIIVLIATATLFMYARRPPKLMDFEINREGVISGEILYPYKNLAGFGVDENDSPAKLILKLNSGFLPTVTLPLTEVDIIEVKNYLLEHLHEEHLKVPAAEKLMDFLGF